MLSDVDLENNRTTIKQVIVMRKDLKMRRGKEIAQGAHASMEFLRCRLYQGGSLSSVTDEQWAWLRGVYAKVTLQVDSLEALAGIHDKAVAAGLEVHIVKDCGRTEFGGVETATCLAIGPDFSEKIDAITGELKCY